MQTLLGRMQVRGGLEKKVEMIWNRAAVATFKQWKGGGKKGKSNILLAGQWWCTPLIPALGRQGRQISVSLSPA